MMSYVIGANPNLMTNIFIMREICAQSYTELRKLHNNRDGDWSDVAVSLKTPGIDDTSKS